MRKVLGAVHPRGPVNTLQMRECTTILMELYRKFLSIPPPQLLAVFHKCLESTLCCDTRQILNKQIKGQLYAFFLPATIRQLILASVISVFFKMLDLPSTMWLQRNWKFNLLLCWLLRPSPVLVQISVYTHIHEQKSNKRNETMHNDIEIHVVDLHRTFVVWM